MTTLYVAGLAILSALALIVLLAAILLPDEEERAWRELRAKKRAEPIRLDVSTRDRQGGEP